MSLTLFETKLPLSQFLCMQYRVFVSGAALSWLAFLIATFVVATMMGWALS